MRRTTIKLISTVAACLLFAITVSSQSTNPSSPTPVNGQYKGKGPSKETNFYFSITGGPGDIRVRLDIKAKDYSTFARIEIDNDPSNLIAMHNMNASTTTGAASVTKEFKLAKKQTVRIKLTLDGNLAEYTLTVDGGIVFSGGGGESTDTGSGGKVGKLTSGGGVKPGKLGAAGIKPKTGTSGATGSSQSISLTCPTQIEYQLVPIADWDPTLYSKKVLKFDTAQGEGNTVYCNYGLSGDSATLTKKVPVGYACSIYSGSPKSRLIVCSTAATAALISPRQEE